MKMIALVSDQRMQNVFPLFQKDAAFNELTLVLSKDRKTEKPLKRYVDSANDLKAVLSPRLPVYLNEDYIDPFEIANAKQAIHSLICVSGDPQNVVVNISGGTKPMAIGALQAAQAAKVKSLYTDTENGDLIWLMPDGTVNTQPIQMDGLNIAIYIRAYGEEIVSFSRVSDLDTKRKQWARIIAENHKVFYERVINPINRMLNEAYKNQQTYPISCMLSPTRRQLDIMQQLSVLGLWQWDESNSSVTIFNRQNAHFINGGWIEVYTGLQIEESGFFDETLLNVKLKGIEGELDLVAIKNGKLVLVECKSNVQRSEQLNKLDAFRRRLGGPFAKAYYVRASDANANQIRKQCEKLKLNGVFFGAELREMGEQIGENMGVVT
ncbi:MAG: DUF1887 family protein [Anaerolineales bacterium]|nr:DUF1887 family protein [Anaerolineales bacterium]